MQHVEIPRELINLKKQGKLEQGDQVIFASIKKYMNDKTRECFPSITTIAKMLRCSRTKIIAAIDRLCECNLLKRTHNGKGSNNTYLFIRTEFDNFFEMFTYDFLNVDMPLNIKEYYMGIQQFLYGKETGVGKCSFSNAQLSEKLGISTISVKKYNTYLIEHNLLEEEETNKTDEAGLTIVQKNFNLAGLQQAALWVKAVTEQVTQNTADIEDMKKELEELKAWKARYERERALERNKTYETPSFDM